MAHHELSDDAKAEAAGILPSHGISLNLPPVSGDGRPPAVKHMSMPAYHSPIRHHKRTPSRTKHVKETLNARSHYGSSDDDGAAIHRINQYIIKQEIGRGSFGAVHLAVDQYGEEYAVKEFSKSRLRKRAQSNLLRRPNQKQHTRHLSAGIGFNSPLHRQSSSDKEQAENNSLDLIKEEIAIMKKLNHNNLVSLIEVLDDPDEDSLYMVLEICKKGVVMKVGLEETADPYDEETCRCWFRDMILGIEYLHAQGIVHRDIKPDNCLITNDDVLKIVDFGVSEMFEKQSDMATAKSAGSPAFMPPELCVARHGQVSGRAADIWSMGVTLYCLRYGKIPFEKHGMLELYEAIRNDDVPLPNEQDDHFKDLMHRLLEKDPAKRITMAELRNHPWVTKGGKDPLLPAGENCADIIEPPTEVEKNHAITGNMGSLFVVMRAVKRFKKLLHRKRPELMEGIFGRASRIVSPPQSFSDPPSHHHKARSIDTEDRRPIAGALAAEGIHYDQMITDDARRLPQGMDRLAVFVSPEDLKTQRAPIWLPSPKSSQSSSGSSEHRQSSGRQKQQQETAAHHPAPRRTGISHDREHAKGHAHDPLSDTLFLDIGTGDDPNPSMVPDGAEDGAGIEHVISESPGAVDIDVYEVAYQEEMKRILEKRGKSATMYLTRRVEGNRDIREHESIISGRRATTDGDGSLGGFAGLVKKAKENVAAREEKAEKFDEEEGKNGS